MNQIGQTGRLLAAQWRALWGARGARWGLLLTAAALCACAVVSGLGARAWHGKFQQLEAGTQAALRQADAQASPAAGDQAAMAAFRFARAHAPAALLPAAGGRALASGMLELLPPAIRVTVESRHTDARSEEKLGNPLLQRYGMADLVTALALLVPLLLVCLCAGMVQGEREQGTWRISLAQGAAGWRLLLAAMAVRTGAVWTLAVLASLLAFMLDPAATLRAFGAWVFCLTAFVLFWSAASAWLNLLPGSAATAVLAGLGLWAVVTFGAPAMIAAATDRMAPMPSRLAAIVQMRAAQQDAEAAAADLVRSWYRAHPQWAPAVPRQHSWPVSFMPRYLDQAARIEPIAAEFERVRAQRFEHAERWAWLSPPLSLLLAADRLAGHDAPRYARYMAQVNRFEAEWRAFFVPRIMSYRGVLPHDYADAPRFAWTDSPPWHAVWRAGLQQLALAAALLGLLWRCRARLARP
ncbi:ABC-type transporter, permease component [Cupriavidus taiwanensis]|uniref:DUF3526 domain-containing protein n=1 Tax=Cupriavidus taiwanensis TaxID=164546 RepID=UPI000E1ADC6B|nr:DUF3526 domain-containing protein [Cupriavidus taiwanensis]SOY92678.1 ABC-type transporter, permease component [Cupriavidus taiwanensis]SOY97108.1 ABC-type transporter, permease component [Cupriavidus taiwanensis]